MRSNFCLVDVKTRKYRNRFDVIRVLVLFVDLLLLVCIPSFRSILRSQLFSELNV
jgi:hypothetical protein